ncbi:MAG TPA: hypothetical protein VFA45_08850, partial [Actinomycetes bacterium]|nr:hypothetical protein [Actinomycetes bacterium]
PPPGGRPMKLHLRAIADHLYFGRGGTVLAAWQVTPRTTRYAADDAKHTLFAQVHGALKGIPARAELLSACRLVDPAEVAEAMLDGVIVADGDHQRFPGWAAEVDATLSYLVRCPTRAASSAGSAAARPTCSASCPPAASPGGRPSSSRSRPRPWA